MSRQGFHAHVVDDEQGGLEVTVEGLFLAAGVAAGGVELAHEFENAAVVNFVTVADGFAAQGLGEVAFADAGRADEQEVARLFDKLTGG